MDNAPKEFADILNGADSDGEPMKISEELKREGYINGILENHEHRLNAKDIEIKNLVAANNWTYYGFILLSVVVGCLIGFHIYFY